MKIGIDFGSAYTNIYLVGNGLVLSEPTVAAVSTSAKGGIVAVGNDAKKLIGKTVANTKIVFPVFEGEIVDENVAIGLLNAFLRKIEAKHGVEAVFSLPCGASLQVVEKFKKLARNCGIKKVYFVEAPVLSALGQRISFENSSPCFVIDMAGGVTNIAVVSSEGVVSGLSANFGVNKICTDIIDFVAEKYNLQIGVVTAERIKDAIASLDELDALDSVVAGHDLTTGEQKTISIVAKDLFDTVQKYFDKIAELSISILQRLPQDAFVKIKKTGLYVSGLGASIHGLEQYYEKTFGIKINIAENSRYSVARGTGFAIRKKELLEKIALPV